MDNEWIAATASNERGIEVRRHGGAVEVRDGADPDGPCLRLTPSQFAAWLDAAKHADLDHLVSERAE